MFVCYVDEAGCTGMLPSATSRVQPVFLLAGLILSQKNIRPFTFDFLTLKKKYFPKAFSHISAFLDCMQEEVKGSNLRKHVRGTSRNRRRHALGFMDQFLQLIERYDGRLIGKLCVKGIGTNFSQQAIYTSAIQDICRFYQQYLYESKDMGFLILDSRDKPRNRNVSHSVFTQKFQTSGDSYDRLLEMPTFGHSENHAGIQAADLICSAFLFPMACYAYCLGYVQNIHVHAQYGKIQEAFGRRLRGVQFRYQDGAGIWRGGITVSDRIKWRHGGILFS